MANATVPPAPPKRRRWLRVLLRAFLGLILLLVVVFFVATSSPFFKGVILPKASKAMNATITVSDASISPFSHVILNDLKVQTTGSEPLLTAKEIRARYSLWAIIRGNIKVDEVTVNSPTVQIVENPDGTSNLDPLTKAKQPEEKKPSAPSSAKAPSKPPAIDIKKVALNNVTVRMVKNYKGGNKDTTEISNLTVGVNGLKNGQSGEINISSGIRLESNPPEGTNSLLLANLNGHFDFGLSEDLKPLDIKGKTHIGVDRAGGSMSQLAGLGVNLDCDITPISIKQVALRIVKGGATLAEARVNGPFNMDSMEGRLTVQILSIDRQVLNLVGAPQGLDFGSTTIGSTNQIALAKAGTLITAAGQLDANKFGVTRADQTTPSLDLRCVYNVTVNLDQKSALLDTLTITATQNQQPLLNAGLAGPMSLSWGAATATVPDSTLNFSITNLNLTDWKPFLGDAVSSGIANVNAKLQSQQAGKQLAFDLASQLDGLTAKVGSNQVNQAGVTLTARGRVADMSKVNLEDYRLQVTQQNQPVVSLGGSGSVDTNRNADLQLTLTSALPGLMQLLAQPGASASSGTVEFKSHITSQKQGQTVTGTLTVADFTGQYQNDKFQKFGVSMDLDVSMSDKLVEVRKANGTLREGANPGGGFEINGKIDTDKKSGQFNLKLADLNQNALRPFLEAALGDKKLVSVDLAGTATAAMGGAEDTSIKADIQLTNLVVSDPKNQLPATPLAAGLKVDASMQKQVADVRQLQLTLTPTQRAKNQLQVQGRLDLSQTNAYEGALKLTAESLDVTPYYDLFTGKPKPASTPTSPTPTPAPAKPEAPAPEEPPAMTLPIRNFSFDANIGRFYLREIEITNWVTALKLDATHVNLQPLQLSINGAPLKATAAVNLGVPGYEYDIAATGDRIPLEPLANTFMPDKKGQYKGDVLLNTQVKGAGTTGANLKKSLAGQLGFTVTNANIQIVSMDWLKQFLSPVATLLNTPELADSPLKWVNARVEIGNGQVDAKDITLVSSFFELKTAGAAPIADVLAKSPIQNWPVGLYLSRSLATRVSFLTSGPATTNEYVQLPNFLKVAGTLGSPKAQIDKTALAGTALEKLGGKIPGLSETTGGLLQGLGGVISGRSPATNPAPNAATNQPATNKAAPPNSLLDLFKKPKK